MPRKTNILNEYLSLRGRLARAVARIVPPAEIEDIVQETYVRVCQLDRRRDIRAPQSFLMKTARNLALDHVKRAESRLTSSVEDDPLRGFGEAADTAGEPYRTAASHEEFAHFCEAVRCLPVQCRRVFVLKKVYGFSQREIAAKLKLSESTVEKHVAEGIKRCAHYMMRQLDADGAAGPDHSKLQGSGRKR